MKTIFKRVSKSTLAIVLTICMLISCMTVGIIATDAAKTESEEVGLDSGDGIHLGIGTTTTTWHGMGNNEYEFTLQSAATIYYTFSVGNSNFGKGNQENPGSDSPASYTYYAQRNNNTQYSISLPAGTYKFKLVGIQASNTNSLEYKFWVVSSDGGGGDEPAASDTIYFDKSGLTGWTTVYAYLYTSSYWDSTKGSGSKNRDDGVEMTYDSALGLYKTSIASNITHVVFLKDEQNGYGNFHQTEAAYIELSETYANDSKFSADTPVYVPDSSKNISKNNTRYYDTADTNHGSWVSATTPTAASLSISANPTELTAVNQSSTITVTATDIASGVTNLTYTIYDRADNSVVGDPVTVTNGATTATFTVTPNARVKSYYASVKPTNSAQQALYDEVWTSTDATITNSADEYIPSYTVTFDSNNTSYGTVTAKKADGTVLSSGASVKEGDSITFTATATTGNVFTGWSEFDTKSSAVTRVIRAATTATGNFGPKGYKVATSTGTTPIAMRELANGTYISTSSYGKGVTFQLFRNATGKRTVASEATQGVDPNGTKYKVTNWETGTTWQTGKLFTTYDNQSGNRYIVYDPATDQVWLSSEADDLYGVNVIAKDGTIRYGWKNVNDYTQVFGDTTIEPVSPSTINGSITDEYGGMAEKCALTAEDVRNGVTLKIKTQTKSTYVSQGYYVKGFVVSGYEESFSVLWQEFVSSDKGAAEKSSYEHRDWIHEGKNEFELTIEGYPEKNIEITPVYAIREATSGANIRFYVEGFAGEVYKEWGGTLAIDAYSTETARKFGEYPGQPMINYNGRYVVDLPREGITGITLNNYVWDRVHSNLFYGTTGTGTDNNFNNTVKANNYQTYDFNDFVYLKQVMDNSHEDEDIIFSFRHRTNDSYKTKDNSQLGKSTYYVNSPNASENKDYDYRKGFNTIDINDSIYHWEDLTDFYGNRVDIFGDIVDIKDSSGTVTNPKAAYTNPIRIVSNGYDYNKAGNYATAWALYEPVDANNQPAYTGTVDHYQLIEVFGGQGIVKADYSERYDSSSYLVNPRWTINLRDKYDYAYSHDSSQEHSTASFVYDLAKVPTVISYEYQVYDSHSNLSLEGGDGQPAYRSDGRWFTSSSNQFLTAHTVIEYAEKDEESLYQRDFYQGNGIDYTSATGYDPTKNTGLATGIQAYFENSDTVTYQGQDFANTSGNTQAYAVSDGEHVFKLKANDDPNGDYVFKGWYMYTNGKYSLVTRDQTYDSEATANDVYVARYYKAPSGTLNITHNLTTDSEGEASCLAKVEVLDSNNDVVATIKDFTTDAIKVTPTYMKNTSNNKLRITLKTSLVGITEYEWTKEDIDGNNILADLTVGGKIASVSAVTTDGNDRTITITTVPIEEFFEPDGTQNVKLLPFYSQTEVPTINYEITYNFPSRGYLIGSNPGAAKYGDLSYTVEGTGKASAILDNGKIKKSLVEEKVPYEKNFMQNMTWQFNNITYSDPTVVNGTTVYHCSVNATTGSLPTVRVEFHFPYDTKAYDVNNAYHDDNGNWNDNKVGTIYGPDDSKELKYGEYQTQAYTGLLYQSNPTVYAWRERTVKDDQGQDVIQKYQEKFSTYAAESVEGHKFLYWSIRSLNRNNPGTTDNPNYTEVARCYEATFNYTIFDNYRVYAIYSDPNESNAQSSETPDNLTDKLTTINFLDYSRNHWNNSAHGSYPTLSEGDAVWTDFDVSFKNGKELISTGSSEVGVLVERVQDTLDENYELNPSAANYSTNYQHYVDKYNQNSGDDKYIKAKWEEAAKTYILGTTLKQNSRTQNEDRVKTVLNSSLTNKNRMEFGFAMFVNSGSQTGSQSEEIVNAKKNGLYRAYSYMRIQTGIDGNNKPVYEIVLCDTPVYFSVKNEASKITNS